MKSHFLKASILASACCICAAAMAENPFVGTWKLDYSKSSVTGQTMSFTPEADGRVRLAVGNLSYTFTIDGKPSTNLVGDTEIWTKEDDHTWKQITQKDGKVIGTDIYKLSSDGNTLDDNGTGTKPNGENFNNTASFTRISPGEGLFGKWRNTSQSEDKPDTTVIEANGDDGIIMKIPSQKTTMTVKFDGKEVAPTGPGAPPNFTFAATRTGPRSYSGVARFKGQIVWKSETTVSADGTTMTEVGGDPSGNEPVTFVYKKM